jgi:hypothetical protein
MKNNMRKHVGTIMTLGVAVLASGCGGGGQSTAPAVPAVAKTKPGAAAVTTKAKLTIKIPLLKGLAGSQSKRRSPLYVSASTQGLAIRAGTHAGSGPPSPSDVGSQPWQSFSVASLNPSTGCSPDSNNSNVEICTLSFTAPVVTGVPDDFQVIATDKAPAAPDSDPATMGNWLSTGWDEEPVVAGTVVQAAATLAGVIATLDAVPAAYSVWAAPGATGSVTVGIDAKDPDGGLISGASGSLVNQIALSDGSLSSLFTYPAPTAITASETGPALATIGYAAPPAAPGLATLPATTVTASTQPAWYAPTIISTTFAIDPMVVSVAGTPVGSIANLAVSAPDVIVTVNESGAKSFNIANNTDAAGTLTLLDATGGTLLTNPVAAPTGTATFVVRGLGASTLGSAPTVTVTDTNGTVATLPAVVAAAPPLSPAAARNRVVR